MTEQYHHPEIPEVDDWEDTNPTTQIETDTQEVDDDKGFDEQDDTAVETEPTDTAPPNYSFTDMGRLFVQVFGHPQQASDQIDEYGLTEEEITNLLEDPNSYLSKILASVTTQYTKQTMYQFRALAEAFRKGADIRPVHKTDHKDQYTDGPKYDKPKSLEGEEAYRTTVARIQRMKKIRLWNSGFWLVVRRLTPDEVRYVQSYVDEDQREIGRMVGGYFYSMEDTLFVKAILEILPSITINSNLKNWKKGSTLSKAIKIIDYPTLLQGFCSLLFRGGVDYEMVCPGAVELTTTDDKGTVTKQKVPCTHSEKVHLDIEELKLVDYSKVPQEAIDILFSNEEFNVKRYNKYSELLGHYAVVSFPADEGRPKIDVHQKVPTCFSQIKYGMQYLGRLKTEIYDKVDSNMDETEQVRLFTAINTYKLFQPWIERVVFYKEDGTVDYETKDPRAIEVMLESDMWSRYPNHTRKFMEFFRKVAVVHMAYSPIRSCPVCNYTPDISDTGNLIPVDMNDFFSNLSFKMILNIMNA